MHFFGFASIAVENNFAQCTQTGDGEMQEVLQLPVLKQFKI